ncbi:uncharacterized protein LOC119731772 isoform X1 [Patiria miniata]|uniref:Methyltransferase domain-containing protein n=1 Tax=Patiria miniata TaxID=46514 RepID=A0A914ABW9_PATMI|nr:uncharacterized protein LOC119731772 isoform X1 [Patiria miniata]XP_038060961.1 uncharacterized protein LOC119731772 isoform X1 [Patiria miniata]
MGDSKDFSNETEKDFNSRMRSIVNNGITCMTMALGFETGLFKLMISMETPKTCQEIADAGKFKERYVREWLGSMVTAYIVSFDPVEEKYWIPKHRHSIAQSRGRAMYTPTLSSAFFDVADCFQKDGPPGVPYEKYDKFDALMTQVHGPVFENEFITDFFPSMPDIQAKLESGLNVLDIGCGAGTSTIEIAKRFPKSHVHGLDFSVTGIKEAQAKADAAGLTNATFICQDVTTLPADWTDKFGYAFAHMVIPNLTDPHRVLKGILRVLTPGGALSVVDPKSHSTLKGNLSEDVKHSHMLYSISLLNCVPASLCKGEGAALGAAMGREKGQALIENAGFNISSISDALGAQHYLCIKPL